MLMLSQVLPPSSERWSGSTGEAGFAMKKSVAPRASTPANSPEGIAIGVQWLASSVVSWSLPSERFVLAP